MKKSTAARTIYYYGKSVMRHWPIFLLGVLASFGYTFCLTFLNAIAVSDIIDRVGEGGIEAGQVLHIFMPYIISMVFVNFV